VENILLKRDLDAIGIFLSFLPKAVRDEKTGNTTMLYKKSRDSNTGLAHIDDVVIRPGARSRWN
jgi:hypothetical protein